MTLRCLYSPIFGLALLASLAGGCGGESTDTGNPSVVLGQKLRLAATETGVRVSGDPGAVPAGARVDVLNTATGESASTNAAADGSFELEIAGSVSDEYSVYAAGDGESWRTRLTSSGATEPQVGLAGRDFLLQSADGFVPVVDTTIRLSFDASELRFSAGCNSHFGAYSLCDGRLCVDGLGSTEIGCDLPLSNQDQWIADFLVGSPALEQAGAGLTLAGAGATLEFLDSEVADADRPLTGRTWSVDTIIENGGASQAFAQPPATLEFGDDGLVSVFTTCSTGYGSYTRSGQTLTLSGVNYTDQSCEGFFLHERITRVMTTGDVTIEIDASFLTITRGNVGLRATTE